MRCAGPALETSSACDGASLTLNPNTNTNTNTNPKTNPKPNPKP